MGKIRVQDLATMMGISNQDLVFKMKSLGVRVEGDDAHIDTENLQAFLQGKKLPHPREVILRDEQAPTAAEAARRRTPTAPAPAMAPRRPPTNPLRPQRPRTLIQKIEPRIQTLPMSERYAPQPALEPAALASAAQQEESEPEILAPAAGAAPAIEALQPAHLQSPQAAQAAQSPLPERREAPAQPPRPSAPPYSSARPGAPSGARPRA